MPKQKPQDEVNKGTEQKNEEPSAGELSSGDQKLLDAAASQTTETTPTTESIKPTTEKSDDVDEVKPEPEVVTLKGWEAGREGTHSIHTKKGVFNFINGKASFSSVIATELREAGYVE